MSERIISCLLLILLSIGLHAQEFNNTELDEKSGKSMLMGYVNRDAFKDSSFHWWYKSGYETYVLNKDTLKGLENSINNYQIIAVIGTWCSDSKREVPRFYKILDSTGYDFKRLKMIAVGRKVRDITGEVADLAVEFVPTFIFLKDENEIGRIVEAPEGILEGDIKRIMEKDITE